MRLTDVIQKTTDEIPSPYDSMQFTVTNTNRMAEDAQQYFYDISSGDGNQRKRGNNRNKDFQKRPRVMETDPGMRKTCSSAESQCVWLSFAGFIHFCSNLLLSVEKCWFCLSSPSVEKHLVITMGDNFYLALAKGPIEKYHILILSITHVQSVSLLSEEDFAELEKFKSALRTFYDSESQKKNRHC